MAFGICWSTATPARAPVQRRRPSTSTESAGAAAVRGVARAALPSRRRQRKQTFSHAMFVPSLLTERPGPTLPPAPPESMRVNTWTWALFWSVRCQLSFFLTCCFSITRLAPQMARARRPRTDNTSTLRRGCVGSRLKPPCSVDDRDRSPSGRSTKIPDSRLDGALRLPQRAQTILAGRGTEITRQVAPVALRPLQLSGPRQSHAQAQPFEDVARATAGPLRQEPRSLLPLGIEPRLFSWRLTPPHPPAKIRP
jgi:hypothetical protein